jgi:hypothetical protein
MTPKSERSWAEAVLGLVFSAIFGKLFSNMGAARGKEAAVESPFSANDSTGHPARVISSTAVAAVFTAPSLVSEAGEKSTEREHPCSQRHV